MEALKGYLTVKSLTMLGYANESADVLIESSVPDHIENELRNVCAKLHYTHDDQINNICALLNLRKRKFIELALLSAVAEAEKIIAELREGESE